MKASVAFLWLPLT